MVKLLETQYNSASEILYQLKLINITFRRITPYCRAVEQLAKYERMYQQQESWYCPYDIINVRKSVVFNKVSLTWCKYVPFVYYKIIYRDGAVVRALASHQCGPSSIPGLDVICGLSWFVVGSRPWSEGFSPGSPMFLPSQKPTLLNSNSTWSAWSRLNEFLELLGLRG